MDNYEAYQILLDQQRNTRQHIQSLYDIITELRVQEHKIASQMDEVRRKMSPLYRLRIAPGRRMTYVMSKSNTTYQEILDDLGKHHIPFTYRWDGEMGHILTVDWP